MTSLRPIRPQSPSVTERVAQVLQTLLSRCWSHERIDAEMRLRLVDALSGIGAHAVLARFFRENLALKFVVPNAGYPLEALDRVVAELDMNSQTWVDNDRASEYRWTPDEILAWPIFQPGGTNSSVLRGYVALCVPPEPTTLKRELFVAGDARTAALAFFQVLQQRAQLYLPFARRMAERYWADAMYHDDCSRRLCLPWERDSTRTVTLGFDLRKSTFCMEGADDPTEFAMWIDDLVQIVMQVGHGYGGVFDKFTGDGGLIHFLEDACQTVDNRPAVESAVRCAVSLQKAVDIHVRRLREFLRLDSDLLGGAIGVDVAGAHWGLDRRQNPLTVGRGVVGACRLMDKAPSFAIQATNIVYRKLDKTLRMAFVAVPFTSKEVPEEMKIKVWEIRDARATGWRDEIGVEDLCEAVYATSQSLKTTKRSSLTESSELRPLIA